jgi:hypothetical protein
LFHQFTQQGQKIVTPIFGIPFSLTVPPLHRGKEIRPPQVGHGEGLPLALEVIVNL